jgi:hypothetical protein
MTKPIKDTSRCAGKVAGTLVHPQCQHCLCRTVQGSRRMAHFLPPEFIAGKCPMRRQS